MYCTFFLTLPHPPGEGRFCWNWAVVLCLTECWTRNGDTSVFSSLVICVDIGYLQNLWSLRYIILWLRDGIGLRLRRLYNYCLFAFNSHNLVYIMVSSLSTVSQSECLLQDYNLSRVVTTMAEGGSGGSGAAPDTGHSSGGQPTAPNSTGLLPLSPPKSEVDESPLQKSMDKNKECKCGFARISSFGDADNLV